MEGGGKKKKKESKWARQKEKKKSKKQTKKQWYHSVDILFPDFRAMSYLRVDICGVSKLTGMPAGALQSTSVDSKWQL